jgi:hypothetical protein
MFEWIKKNITPAILISLFAVLFAVFSFTKESSAKNGQLEQRVTTVEKQLDAKAEKKDIEYLIKIMEEQGQRNIRIEEKLDKHMEKK